MLRCIGRLHVSADRNLLCTLVHSGVSTLLWGATRAHCRRTVCARPAPSDRFTREKPVLDLEKNRAVSGVVPGHTSLRHNSHQ